MAYGRQRSTAYWVDPQYQGRGIASKLLSDLLCKYGVVSSMGGVVPDEKECNILSKSWVWDHGGGNTAADQKEIRGLNILLRGGQVNFTPAHIYMLWFVTKQVPDCYDKDSVTEGGKCHDLLFGNAGFRGRTRINLRCCMSRTVSRCFILQKQIFKRRTWGAEDCVHDSFLRFCRTWIR